jgi:hypothetical protein
MTALRMAGGLRVDPRRLGARREKALVLRAEGLSERAIAKALGPAVPRSGGTCNWRAPRVPL